MMLNGFHYDDGTPCQVQGCARPHRPPLGESLVQFGEGVVGETGTVEEQIARHEQALGDGRDLARPVFITRRTPEGRAAYFAEQRAELLAAGKLEEVASLEAVVSVLDGETAEQYEARRKDAVLSNATLAAVAAEALRAHRKHGPNGGSLLDLGMGVDRRLAALGEEFGEVCRALTYDGGQGVEHLIKELVQTASVALTWVEHLRRWGDAL
jgi:hypothetical protein